MGRRVERVHGITHEAPLSFILVSAGLKKGDRLLDLFCGVGLMGLSLAKRMQDLKQPLRALEGYEIYNQAINDARGNAKAMLLTKKKGVIMKAADLSQPTLGARINCDVAICGTPSPPWIRAA